MFDLCLVSMLFVCQHEDGINQHLHNAHNYGLCAWYVEVLSGQQCLTACRVNFLEFLSCTSLSSV